MLRRVALMASVSVAACFGWFVWRHGLGVPVEALRTETFTMLAMCQWFNVLSCQSATRSALRLGVLRNPWLLGGLLLSIGLQALVIWAPFMQDWFHTVPLAPGVLGPMLGLASAVLWAEELRKLMARHRAAAS
jgi:Ca2+-transporting ATPase